VILGVPGRTHPKESTRWPSPSLTSVSCLLRSVLATASILSVTRSGSSSKSLVEAEATQGIGAGHYERSGERVTKRNGRRPKTLSTKAGDIEVGIPKLRKGSFFPSILEPRRRIDQALSVVMEACVKGVSTRSVDDPVAARGVSSNVSRSEVWRICRRRDEEAEAFRTRRLGHARLPYGYLDATYLHVRADHHVVSKAAVIAPGVREDGHREVLGVSVGDSEDELFWRMFLTG
jgi:putative transposase